ncbi:MAG TPA: hypothetical protein VNW90_19220 [Acetobacteraceae bacterium]|jgi:hypothetical protein|nr:hypothetical protein [Acetobacteraceae bacterium]
MSDNRWRRDAEAALVELTAAALALDAKKALGHLRDARYNVQMAIEKLEDED